MMAPSTSFPGNIGFYLTLIAFVSLFLFLAGLRALVIAGGKREDRLGSARDIVERIVTLPYLVLATMRLNRPAYWYAGLRSRYLPPVTPPERMSRSSRWACHSIASLRRSGVAASSS